jgi:ABC-type arginine/histidine transport system permease subunit
LTLTLPTQQLAHIELSLSILLALGRRSEMTLIRWFSIGYIELIRGAL